MDVLGIEDYSVSQTTLDNVRLATGRAAGYSSLGRVAVPATGAVPKRLADGTGGGAGGPRGRPGGWRCWRGSLAASCPILPQVFVNFAKKQSDNLEQQETSPGCALPSPLERLLSLLRPRAAPTELRALVAEEQEDLETDDEGLISFEEERVRGCPRTQLCLRPAVSLPGCHRSGSRPGKGMWWGPGAGLPGCAGLTG